MHQIYNLLAIMIGGIIGTLLRYTISINLFFEHLPYATILVNVLGSLLMGMLAGWLVYNKMPVYLRLGVVAGFLGGFTTMSTLAYDVVYLFMSYSAFSSSVYILLSLIGGITAALLGFLGIRELGQLKNNHSKKGS